jgi:hypothetical protein
MNLNEVQRIFMLLNFINKNEITTFFYLFKLLYITINYKKK